MSQEQRRAEPHLWNYIHYQTIPQPRRAAPVRDPISSFETFRHLQKKDKSDRSSATKAFEVPEILKCILDYLSVEDFMDAQMIHPQFVAVALLYPHLRYKFFLEEDPVLREHSNAKPRINPLFGKAVLAGGGVLCDACVDRKLTRIYCS